MRMRFSTILTCIVQCGSFEEKTHQRKPNWVFILIIVSFAASGIRYEYYIASCSSRDTSSIPFTPTKFSQKLVNVIRGKRPRGASVPLRDNARLHFANETCEKLEKLG